MAKGSNNNPVPLRLGEHRPVLHRRAMQMDRPLHWLLKMIIVEWLKNHPEDKKEEKK